MKAGKDRQKQAKRTMVIEAKPGPPRAGGRRLVLSLLALGLLYANVAAIFNPSLGKVGLPKFPIPDSVRDPFVIFGVFSYYETNNQELTIWGLADNPRTGEKYWKQLPSYDYFPYSRGEQASRMWAERQYNSQGRKARWAAWQFMGTRIMERYNREYPTDPIEKVAFQSLTWPRSTQGFYASQSTRQMKRDFWIIAESAK
jgi:hypothetical protein